MVAIPRHHRQPHQSFDQIRSSQMRVAIHRQADRRVPGKRLGDLGRTVGCDQISDKSVARGMKIDNVPLVLLSIGAITLLAYAWRRRS